MSDCGCRAGRLAGSGGFGHGAHRLQRYGTLGVLRHRGTAHRGTLAQALAPLGIAIGWSEFPAGPQMLEAILGKLAMFWRPLLPDQRQDRLHDDERPRVPADRHRDARHPGLRLLGKAADLVARWLERRCIGWHASYRPAEGR